MKRKVIRIGNAVGVTLPKAVLARYELRVGEPVDVTAAAGHIEITPRRDLATLFGGWRPIAREVTLDEITRAVRQERDSR